MPAPGVYLDEMVDHALAGTLRLRGFTVTTARDEGMLRASDEAQLRFATSRNLVILTHNTWHFRRRHQEFTRQGEAHAGIVLLPGPDLLPRLTTRAAMMLDWIGSLAEHRLRLFQWGDLQFLLTRGLRLSGYSEAEVRLAVGQERR